MICLIGPGLVGKAVLDQISGLKQKIKVVGIANSKKLLLGDDLGSNDLSTLSIKGVAMNLEYLMDNLPNGTIVVDCTASDTFPTHYPKLLQNGFSVVTANKKGLSGDQLLWSQIFKQGHFFHESSVGAGLPVISTLNDLIATGDEVYKIEGVLSGTLSYVFNEFCSSDQKFSDIIKKAKDLGYTEPDPRDDLNGMDVGRKVTILARLCGMQTFIGEKGQGVQVEIESLVPKELQQVEQVNEFMSKLPQFADAYFQRLKEQHQGKLLRYVGIVDLKQNKIKASLESFDKSHPMASLEASDNIIIFWTKRYGKRPLVIMGAGAGAEVTAHGVVADVIRCSKLK